MAKGRRVRSTLPFAGAIPRKLPHIDEVALAFHMFRGAVSRIMRQHPSMSVEMVRAFDTARSELKTELTTMGLAAHIDWRPKE